jgi:hypothetical protein
MSDQPFPLHQRPLEPTPQSDATAASTSVSGVAKFLPTFLDLFFISLISWLFLSSKEGWSALLLDADIGWHIRTGEWILDRRQIPHVDLFSFSKPGGQWFAWEWLSEVLFASLHRWIGLKGVVLAAGFTIGTFATLLLRHAVWKGANAFVAVAITLLSVGSTSVHFHARPHIFTLFFLTLTLFMIDLDLKQQRKWIWSLIPITVLWTNLHGGFPLLIASLGLVAVGVALEQLLGWRPAEPRWNTPLRYLALATGCGLASLINPYGYNVHLHIVKYLKDDFIRNNVMEFMAPDFRSEPLLQFKVILFLGLLAAGASLLRRQVIPALMLIFFAHQALQSIRHVTLFVILAAPFIALQLTQLWAYFAARAQRKDTVRLTFDVAQDATSKLVHVTPLPLIFALGLLFLDLPIRWPKNFPSEMFPTALAAEHKELLITTKVLTPDQWGDYLIYQSYPRQRVFFDGRSDFYGGDLGREYLGMLQGRHDWKKLLAKHGFETVLCPPSWPLSSLLKESADWVLVADKGASLLFRRRDSIGRPAAVAEGKVNNATKAMPARSS